MVRTVFFGTLHEPGLTHEIAFDSYAVAKNNRAPNPNIVAVEAAYYASNGRLIAQESLDHLVPVTSLKSDFDEAGLIMLRVQYGSVPPFNIYGFVIRRATGDGLTYPVTAAIGWSETTVWPNRGLMPTGEPPEGWRHEIFVANPSRWAEIRVKLILYRDGARRTLLRTLAPKESTVLPVESLAREVGIGHATDAIAVIARNKPVVYVLGRNIETEALSFVEHLVTYPRTNFQIPPPALHEQLDRNLSDPLHQEFCFCSGMSLNEALAHEHEGRVGNYCTGCRDDLRFARQALESGQKFPLASIQ